MAPRTRAQRKRAREEEDEKRCRLCLEGEADGPLVQLCACRGSAKLVHRHCLEKWRRTSPKEDAAYRCGECKDEYRDALSLELLSARLQEERTDGGVNNLGCATPSRSYHPLGCLVGRMTSMRKFGVKKTDIQRSITISVGATTVLYRDLRRSSIEEKDTDQLRLHVTHSHPVIWKPCTHPP